jgi:hypothetical protein
MRFRAATALLVLAFFAQLGFGYAQRHVRPNWEILEPPMSDKALAAAAFGDRQFLYRLLVMQLQHAGDEGGRVVPIKDYDVDLVVAWMEMLDRLDVRAHHHIGLALRYFSLNQNKPAIEPLVRYAMRHVAKDPRRKLDWLSQAMMMAEVRLKNPALTLEIADQMGSYEFPDVNPIAFQIAPILREKQGDLPGALVGMERALRLTQSRATAAEIAFMEQFIAGLKSRLVPPA